MLTVDSLSEVRSMEFYVPRDEAFSISKQGNTLMKAFNSMLHGFLLPALEDNFNKHYSTLFETKHDRSPCPKLVQILTDKAMDILLLHSSQTSYGDKFFWFRDEEFARQTLAGLNPYSIRLVTEWPLKSKLDPSIYGSPESAITDEIVEQQIKGVMSLDEGISC
uniref:Lipoxygenase domain-containing protein n=1 Tax=Cucumis sativus TaxID=3659 RepID=A0A0A0KWY8_CUCSA